MLQPHTSVGVKPLLSKIQTELNQHHSRFAPVEGDDYVFMDTESFEETRLKRDDWADFLKEGSAAALMFYNGKVISVDPPQFVELKVG